MGWVVNAMPWLLDPTERAPIPTEQDAGLALEAGLDWYGKSRPPTGVQTQAHPAGKETLY